MGLVNRNGAKIGEIIVQGDKHMDEVENYICLARMIAEKQFSVLKDKHDETFSLLTVQIALMIQKEKQFAKQWEDEQDTLPF